MPGMEWLEPAHRNRWTIRAGSKNLCEIYSYGEDDPLKRRAPRGFKVLRCNKSARFVTLPTMTTTQSKHRARGIHAIGGKTHQSLPGNGSNLPEYPEQPEAQEVISSAPSPPAKLLMLGQWRPDLWASDALALRPGLEPALPV